MLATVSGEASSIELISGPGLAARPGEGRRSHSRAADVETSPSQLGPAPSHPYFCDGRTSVRVGLLRPAYRPRHNQQRRQVRGPCGVSSTRAQEGVDLLDEQPNRRPLKRVAYRPREVAEMVGMSESGVRNLIKRGTLRAVQLDGRWLFRLPSSRTNSASGSMPSPPPTLRRFALCVASRRQEVTWMWRDRDRYPEHN